MHGLSILLILKRLRSIAMIGDSPRSHGKCENRGKAGKRESERGKRDGSDIVKLGGPADVRAIFTRARHFDFGPPFAGDPWDDRPTLGPNVSRFPSAIPAGQGAASLHAAAKRFQFLRVVGLIDPLEPIRWHIDRPRRQQRPLFSRRMTALPQA